MTLLKSALAVLLVQVGLWAVEPVFRISFDQGVEPEAGLASSAVMQGNGLVFGSPGCPANRQGTALDQQNVAKRTERGGTLSFGAEGHFNPREGAVSFWLKRYGGGTYNTFFAVGNALWDKSHQFNIFYETNQEKLYVRYRRNKDEWLDAVIDEPIVVDRWYHCAATWWYDAEEQVMHLDAYLANEYATPIHAEGEARWDDDAKAFAGLVAGNRRIWLSTSTGGLTPANGMIDEVAVYDERVSVDELFSKQAAGGQEDAAALSQEVVRASTDAGTARAKVPLAEVEGLQGFYQPIIPVPALVSLPVIDGEVDETFALETTAIPGMFLLDTLSPPTSHTDVYLGSYGDKLYVAAKCSFNPKKQLKAFAHDRDGAVYKDDCVELFVYDPATKQNYHWIVNSIGTVYDGIDHDSTWDGKAVIAAAVKEDSWLVEFLVDMNRLGVSSVDELRLNVTRNDSTRVPAELGTLVPIAGESFFAKQFYARLRGAAEPFRVRYGFIAGGPGIHGFNAAVSSDSTQANTMVYSQVYWPERNEFIQRLSQAILSDQTAFDHQLSITDPVVHQTIIAKDGYVAANVASAVRSEPLIETDAEVVIDPADYPWIGNTLGIDREVPTPWRPMTYRDGSVYVTDRCYELNQSALFEQITSVEQALLAGPMNLYVEAGGQVISARYSEAQVEQADDRIVLRRELWWGEAARADLVITMDYDGLAWHELTMTAAQPIEQCYLAIDFNPQAASFLISSDAVNVQRNEQVRFPKRSDVMDFRFMPYIWLGNEDVGLTVTVESDENFHVSDLREVYQLRCGDDRYALRLNFITQSVQPEGLTLTWGVQALPAKPMSVDVDRHMAWVDVHDPAVLRRELHDYVGQPVNYFDWFAEQGVKTLVLFNHWARYQGSHTATDAEAVRWTVEQAHQRGIKVLLYRSLELSNADPYWPVFSQSCLGQPTSYGYRRKRPVKQTSYIYCCNSMMQDYFIWSCDWLMREYDVDGFYLDGVAGPAGCFNGEHGCGYMDSQGQRHLTYNIHANRQLMQRLYKLVKGRKPDGFVDVHSSITVFSSSMAFATGFYAGEQYYKMRRYDKAPLDVLPLDVFRGLFLPYGKGLAGQMLIYEGCPFIPDEANALCFIHGISPRPHALDHLHGRNNLRKTGPIWQALRDYGIEEARWVPYWSPEHDVAYATEPSNPILKKNVVISYYEKDGDYLYFLSNFYVHTLHVDVVNRAMGSGAWAVYDAVTDEPIYTHDKVFGLTLEPYKLRVIRVTKE